MYGRRLNSFWSYLENPGSYHFEVIWILQRTAPVKHLKDAFEGVFDEGDGICCIWNACRRFLHIHFLSEINDHVTSNLTNFTDSVLEEKVRTKLRPGQSMAFWTGSGREKIRTYSRPGPGIDGPSDPFREMFEKADRNGARKIWKCGPDWTRTK